jgi:hypothetical protein
MHLQVMPVQHAEVLGRKRPVSTFGIRRLILFTLVQLLSQATPITGLLTI